MLAIVMADMFFALHMTEAPDTQGRAQLPPQQLPPLMSTKQLPGITPAAPGTSTQPPAYSAIGSGTGTFAATAPSLGAGTLVDAQHAHAAQPVQLITPHAAGVSPAQASSLSSYLTCSTAPQSMAQHLQGYKLQSEQAHESPSTPVRKVQGSHSDTGATTDSGGSVGYKPSQNILASPQLLPALSGSLGGVATPERPPGMDTSDQAEASEDRGGDEAHSAPQKVAGLCDAQQLMAAGAAQATMLHLGGGEQGRAGFAGIPGTQHAAEQLFAVPAAHSGAQRWGAAAAPPQQQAQPPPQQQAAWLQQPPFSAFATPLLRLPASPGMPNWAAAQAQASLFAAASHLDPPAAALPAPSHAGASSASLLGFGQSATRDWAAAERRREAQQQLQLQQQGGLGAPVLAFPGAQQQQGLAPRSSVSFEVPRQQAGAGVTYPFAGTRLVSSDLAAAYSAHAPEPTQITQPPDSPRAFSSASSWVTTPGSAHSLPANAWAAAAERQAAQSSGWAQGHSPQSDSAVHRTAALEARSVLGSGKRLDYGGSKVDHTSYIAEHPTKSDVLGAAGGQSTAVQQPQQGEGAGGSEGERAPSEGELARESSLGSLTTVDEEPDLAARPGEPDVALAGRADAGHARRRGGRGRAHSARTGAHAGAAQPTEGAAGSPARLNRPSGPMKLADVILPALEARAKEHALQQQQLQEPAAAPANEEPEQAGAVHRQEDQQPKGDEQRDPQPPLPPEPREQQQQAAKPALCGGRTFAEIVGREQPGRDQAPLLARGAPPPPPAVAKPEQASQVRTL